MTTQDYLFDGQKMCAKCGRWLPQSSFSPNAKVSSGLSSWCRACANAATQRWREERPEHQAAYNERRRKPRRKIACAECGETFQASHPRYLYFSKKCRVRSENRRYRSRSRD